MTILAPYGMTGLDSLSSSAVNVDQRHIRCVPFSVNITDTYDEFKINVQTGVANSTIEVGIYKSQTSGTSAGFPGDKVSSVEINSESTGYATASVTAFELEAGEIYWMAYRKGETGGETGKITSYKWVNPQMQFGMTNGAMNSVLFYVSSASGLMPASLSSSGPSQTYLSYLPFVVAVAE